MRTQTSKAKLNSSLQYKIIPIVENRLHFARVFETPHIRTLLLRHCNLFELTTFLQRAQQREITTYVNVDQIDGIHPDEAGLTYLADHFHIHGIVSNHARVLALGKQCGLKTIQRIFAVDSTGLEMSLESVNTCDVDLLDISPALVLPHLVMRSPLPFIASGLLYTAQQIEATLLAGAEGVAVSSPDLWS
ncbi:hypothetical protein EPA93_23650 [Ktedonosporobacter rubrisoli]|uniref:Glycerol-3-phosphate responsive antiterminator n=1 Tax=Ktedonosporobacter rubrisoli TaxID=2509675 RepID=A0A4P6JV42_KTERU|nr:glycerol-3-phosphate responsive antiterminator [Ktedonosporobacter rubrisoli]QBD78816.1 hypothetical protein EPA93_23650 [Ktedonosporobacter rubrisoli]